MREFTASELRNFLESTPGSPLLLDVREPWEYETCHIEGATLIPMSRIAAAVTSLDPQCTTVVICHHGIRSRMVARHLENAGFTDVINLAGGVDGWAKDVDPAMAVY